MGFKSAVVGVLVMLLVCLSEAQWRGRSVQWRGRSAQTRNPNVFRPRSLMQVPQQSDSRIPKFVPQQFSLRPSGMAGGKPVQDPLGVQSKQLLQGPVEPLTWTFPTLPPELAQPDIPFALRTPISPNSVVAQCGENSVYMEVMEDFFGTGKPLTASGFTLGDCTATGEDPTAKVLIFESELHGCGSMLTETEDELIYIFSLVYTPQDALSSSPILRNSGAVVGIECHYPKMNNVSSNALMPTWAPYAATMVAEELLVFSLKLMTDDWRFQRPSNQYFLGDVINIEACVMTYNHAPFRLFVDNCVATAVPDINSEPRYSFIENYGCLVDAKITGSSSYFLPRTQGDKLQFQLDAFRFQQDNSGQVYITCVLKVAAASTPTNAVQKACSFSANRWVSADESDQVCGCCDSNCGMGIGSDQAFKDVQSQMRMASLGPIEIKQYGYGQM